MNTDKEITKQLQDPKVLSALKKTVKRLDAELCDSYRDNIKRATIELQSALGKLISQYNVYVDAQMKYIAERTEKAL